MSQENNFLVLTTGGAADPLHRCERVCHPLSAGEVQERVEALALDQDLRVEIYVNVKALSPAEGVRLGLLQREKDEEWEATHFMLNGVAVGLILGLGIAMLTF